MRNGYSCTEICLLGNYLDSLPLPIPVIAMKTAIGHTISPQDNQDITSLDEPSAIQERTPNAGQVSDLEIKNRDLEIEDLYQRLTEITDIEERNQVLEELERVTGVKLIY